jgi:NAD-dependent SIR2 family protein deacetylase
MKINEIKNNPMSETYTLIQQVIDTFKENFENFGNLGNSGNSGNSENKRNCCIMTQNVDGLVNKITGAETIELHGNLNRAICKKCHLTYNIRLRHEDKLCDKCFKVLHPDIILLGENLKVNVSKQIKKHYDYVLIIGTTLQFPYLRSIINKVKQRGAKVIHINPDVHYADYKMEPKYNSLSFYDMKYKVESNVRKNEKFINLTAAEGLKEFINLYCF